MSLPTLISRLSRSEARYVTCDGRVVASLEAAPAPATGGSQTAVRVRPHHHHGGACVANVDEPGDGWWSTDPERLADERRRFVGFVSDAESIVRNSRPGYRVRFRPGLGSEFVIDLVHRSDGGLPDAFPVKPTTFARSRNGRRGSRLQHAPHMWADGRICYARGKDWDAAHDDMLTVFAWVAHWLTVYEQWRKVGAPWVEQVA